MKTCTCCKETKPATLEFFFKQGGGRTDLQAQCKACMLLKKKEYRDKNPEIHRASSKRWKDNNEEAVYFKWVTRKYGITKQNYLTLWQAQGGLCSICETPLGVDKRPAVDHDHVTGKVRGLLCSKCNTGLGQFNDNPDLLLLACDYLLDFIELNPKEEDEFV